MSLPEACRLSDALASQLRVRLGLELSGAEVTTRLRSLRAQLERIRDQVVTEPAGSRQQQAAEQQSRLARRLRELTEKADRGGDVGGLLEPLEIEATTFERDLIVGGARRREAGAKVAQARRLRSELAAPGGRHPGAGRTLSGHGGSRPALRGAGRRRARSGAEHAGRAGGLPRAAGSGRPGHDAWSSRRTPTRWPGTPSWCDRLDAYRVKAEATGVAAQPDVVPGLPAGHRDSAAAGPRRWPSPSSWSRSTRPICAPSRPTSEVRS